MHEARTLDYNEWLEDVFGCQQHRPCVQDIGNVDTREGLLSFPSILLHRVESFKLADPTKPKARHRKIVALLSARRMLLFRERIGG